MVIEEDKWEVAASLDGMERYGRHITLKELQERKIRIELMVTGTGLSIFKAFVLGKVTVLYLEWAMLSEIMW